MKNADMPAMPTQSNGGDIFGGLTKREMMAMHAPGAPSWFEREWCKSNENERRYFDHKRGVHTSQSPAHMISITIEGISSMYFAWRTYYAEMMLSELERTAK